MQKFRLSAFVALVTPILGFTQSQAAYPNRIHIEAVMKEQQRSNIYDRLHPGDVFMQIRRKGTAYGSGLLNRAKIVETAEFLVAATRRQSRNKRSRDKLNFGSSSRERCPRLNQLPHRVDQNLGLLALGSRKIRL